MARTSYNLQINNWSQASSLGKQIRLSSLIHHGVELQVFVIPNINGLLVEGVRRCAGIFIRSLRDGEPIVFNDGEHLTLRFELEINDPISGQLITRDRVVTIDHIRSDMGYSNLFSMEPGSPYREMETLSFVVSLTLHSYVRHAIAI